jgi:hypothetical protein
MSCWAHGEQTTGGLPIRKIFLWAYSRDAVPLNTKSPKQCVPGGAINCGVKCFFFKLAGPIPRRWTDAGRPEWCKAKPSRSPASPAKFKTGKYGGQSAKIRNSANSH